jgi:hypothetical protein
MKKYTPTAGDVQAIKDAASELGISAFNLTKAMLYESAGTLNPGIVGGDNNHFQGLIQFGPRERRAYGYSPGMSFAAQVRGPVVAYLKDRGVRPGMGYDQIYTAINYGNIRSGKVPYGFRDGSGRTLRQNIAAASRFDGLARQIIGMPAVAATGVGSDFAASSLATRNAAMKAGQTVAAASGAATALRVPLPRQRPALPMVQRCIVSRRVRRA